MEVIEWRRRLRRNIIEEATYWAGKLPFKATAILIGSYAKGDFNLWSDVDILLVSEELNGNPIERLKALDIPPGFQVIPLTPKEYRKLTLKRNPIIEAAENGVVLRDDFKITTTNNN